MTRAANHWIQDFDDDVLSYPALLDAAQMQAVDQRAIDQGLESFTLMQRAAAGVCEHVLQLLEVDGCNPLDARILVLAGPGNNGGDGLVAGAMLRDEGCSVSLLRLGAEPISGYDVDKARALWNAPELSLENPALVSLVEQATITIDALFGAGLSRALDASVADLVRSVNAAGAKVVAVDVPSGLDGNSHQAFDTCIQAHSTVTFFRFKPAHVLYPGRALCGNKHLVQIGLSKQQLDDNHAGCYFNCPDVFKHALPKLDATCHKFNRGHVLVRSGPAHATGAARLSAGTALYSGAGLVTLASRKNALAVNAAHLTAVMLAECDTSDAWQSLLADERINTLLIGPGNGVDDDTRQAVRIGLQSNKACVLDADALSCWEGQADSILPLMTKSEPSVVLTPHAGEFQRLFGDTQAFDLPSRLHQARAAARLCSGTVILKGADTVVAAADGRASINANAPAWLATAGAGDVLAGLVASLLAQGMPAFEASCAAVWFHGRAAMRLGYPLCSEQLVAQAGYELGQQVRNITPGR